MSNGQSNHEIRSSKSEIRKKSEARNPKMNTAVITRFLAFGLRISGFSRIFHPPQSPRTLSRSRICEEGRTTLDRRACYGGRADFGFRI